jgi:hypothetical protein
LTVKKHIESGNEQWEGWGMDRLRWLESLRVHLGLPSLQRAWAPAAGVLVYTQTSDAASVLRITGGVDGWSVFGAGFVADTSVNLETTPGMERCPPLMSATFKSLGAGAKLSLPGYNSTLFDADFWPQYPFNFTSLPANKRPLPSTVKQRLDIVRATYRAGYPQMALGLFLSLVGSKGYSGLTGMSVTLTTASTLTTWYAATVNVNYLNATGINVLADDTILVTIHTTCPTATSFKDTKTGLTSGRPVPAPTIGIGASPDLDTVYHTFVNDAPRGRIDLAARSVAPFAIGIMRVNNAWTGSGSPFSSGVLADARQALSAYVSPSLVGSPRGESPSDTGAYGTGVVVVGSGGTSTVHTIAADCYPVNDGHAIYVAHATQTYVVATGVWTAIVWSALVAGVIKATAFDTLTVQRTADLLQYLSYNGNTGAIAAANELRVRGLDDRTFLKLQNDPTWPNYPTGPNPPDRWTVTYDGDPSTRDDSDTWTGSSSSMAGGRVSIQSRKSGNNCVLKAYVDGVQVHTATHVKSGVDNMTPATWSAPGSDSGPSRQVRMDGVAANMVVHSCGPFFYAQEPGPLQSQYSFQDFPNWRYGEQAQTHAGNTRHYFMLTVHDTSPGRVLVYTDYFSAWSWSCRLATLPEYEFITTYPTNFSDLFGYTEETALIYCPNGEQPSGQDGEPETDLEATAHTNIKSLFTTMSTNYTAFRAMPSGTADEIAARKAAWDAIRATGVAAFGSYHTVVWTDRVPAPGPERNKLVQALSGVGWYNHGSAGTVCDFRGAVALTGLAKGFSGTYNAT